jgi:hypothetical protein
MLRGEEGIPPHVRSGPCDEMVRKNWKQLEKREKERPDEHAEAERWADKIVQEREARKAAKKDN